MAFRRRDRNPVPVWAPFLTSEQWNDLRPRIDAEVRRRGLMWDGGDDWDAVITKQFDILQSTTSVHRVITELANPQDALRVALRSVDELVTNPRLVHKAWWPGTILATMFDLPDVAKSASVDELHAIGVDASALHQQCLKNVWQKDQPTRRDLTIDDAPALMLTGDVFTSTFALWPSRFVDVDPTSGVLIAVPNRHTVVLHAIGPTSTLGIVESLVGRMLPIWDGEPGPISPSLFWTDGTDETTSATEVAVTVTGRDVAVHIPETVTARFER